MASLNSRPSDDFEKWVRENGGDDELIELLKGNGFTSKLSLGNLDFKSPDASLFVDLLNYGQKCLLQGLVKLLNTQIGEPSRDPYSAGVSKASSLSAVSNSSSLKEKIGRMFHRRTPAGEKLDKGLEFEPVAAYPKAKKSGAKRKAPEGRGKDGPMKKKIKQLKLKIIALPKMLKRTPTGAYRDQLTHHLWININASEEETKEKIANMLGWPNPKSVDFLYAQGKNLRKAELRDVENAESWDLDTLRALMGSGALYVFKNPEFESSESEMSDDSDFVSVEKSGSHVSKPFNAIEHCLLQRVSKSPQI